MKSYFNWCALKIHKLPYFLTHDKTLLPKEVRLRFTLSCLSNVFWNATSNKSRQQPLCLTSCVELTKASQAVCNVLWSWCSLDFEAGSPDERVCVVCGCSERWRGCFSKPCPCAMQTDCERQQLIVSPVLCLGEWVSSIYRGSAGLAESITASRTLWKTHAVDILWAGGLWDHGHNQGREFSAEPIVGRCLSSSLDPNMIIMIRTQWAARWRSG